MGILLFEYLLYFGRLSLDVVFCSFVVDKYKINYLFLIYLVYYGGEEAGLG